MTKSLVVRSKVQPGESEAWQFREFQAGITELDAGESVAHEKVVQWLASWGKPEESKPPQ